VLTGGAEAAGTFKIKINYSKQPAKRKWEQIAGARGSKPAGEHHEAFQEYVARAAEERPPTSKRKLEQVDVTAPPKQKIEETLRQMKAAIKQTDKILVDAYDNVVTKKVERQAPRRWQRTSETEASSQRHTRVRRRVEASGQNFAPALKRKLDKETYRQTRRNVRRHYRGICREANDAAMSGQIGAVYTAIRRIPKDGQTRFQQTSADEEGNDYKNLAAAVEDWYKFAKNAYSATDEEFFRDEEEELEMPATAEPITDDRILRHARTVKVGKATGESDEAPIEAILACTSTTDTLIQLVRIMYDTAVMGCHLPVVTPKHCLFHPCGSAGSYSAVWNVNEQQRAPNGGGPFRQAHSHCAVVLNSPRYWESLLPARHGAPATLFMPTCRVTTGVRGCWTAPLLDTAMIATAGSSGVISASLVS
jgi:hypothetical protein